MYGVLVAIGMSGDIETIHQSFQDCRCRIAESTSAQGVLPSRMRGQMEVRRDHYTEPCAGCDVNVRIDARSDEAWASVLEAD